MDVRLQDLIIWPDHESLQKTMPECFQQFFGEKVAIIIDCFEIFIERPSNPKPGHLPGLIVNITTLQKF